MRLVEKVHFDDKEVHVNVVGFVTTTGCPTHCDVKVGVVPPGTTKKFEWSTNRDGSLKELEQAMTIGRGSKRIRVEADYDGKKKQTTIKQAGKDGFSLNPPPGQVLPANGDAKRAPRQRFQGPRCAVRSDQHAGCSSRSGANDSHEAVNPSAGFMLGPPPSEPS